MKGPQMVALLLNEDRFGTLTQFQAESRDSLLAYVRQAHPEWQASLKLESDYCDLTRIREKFASQLPIIVPLWEGISFRMNKEAEDLLMDRRCHIIVLETFRGVRTRQLEEVPLGQPIRRLEDVLFKCWSVARYPKSFCVQDLKDDLAAPWHASLGISHKDR